MKKSIHFTKITGIIIMAVMAFFFAGCREYYDPQFTTPETGYLVVEGFINNGTEPTEIRLTRTVQLDGAATPIPETGANVMVESEGNERFSLAETVPGVYRSGQLQLNGSSKYRIHIYAKEKEYVSAFSGIQTTPDIDSISWKQHNEGVQFHVHASDPTGNARYYQWKFEETWETNSPYVSNLVYAYDAQDKITGVKYRYPNRINEASFIRCWSEKKSAGILIGSTEKLAEDVVYLPFHFIEANSVKISIMYSVLLKQYKLSKAAHAFLLQMKKNSEQLGSIFDAQPSEMPGNMYCLTEPGEPVIGFVEVTEEKTRRLFISNGALQNWNYQTGCAVTVIDNHPDSIVKYGLQLMPGTVAKDDEITGDITHFSAAPPRCIDCRQNGGTNIKPLFWP
ncbi:MAG: DUF4249 domain-containing protein [Chitinophagaceae bacterium]